jgi:hypothetical protein
MFSKTDVAEGKTVFIYIVGRDGAICRGLLFAVPPPPLGAVSGKRNKIC